jgi:tRNA-binding EMAP/Myf-like protein
MSVIAMEVMSVDAHPNADALLVYTMQVPGQEPVQVVGNLERQYEAGQTVAVARPGAKLHDGTKIRPAKLRGVQSLGMLIEPVDVELGSDLTSTYCVPAPPPPTTPEEAPGMPVARWSKIQLLHHVLRDFEGRREAIGTQYVFPKRVYRGKIKLDGTNGGVHVLANGEIVAQSRSRILTLEDDNSLFAFWVDKNKDYFQGLSFSHPHTIVYGEWCGQGIQKRTAISKIGKRVFAVFAIQYGDQNVEDATWEIEPERIRALLPEHPDVYVLPWSTPEVMLDFGDRDLLKEAADEINAWVDQAEEKDPWVAETFGVEGLGEGFVMYPMLNGMTEGPVSRDDCSYLMFKAKGEKHQVVKQKKAVQIDPEVARSIEHFAEMFVTEARLEQALKEGCEERLESSLIPDFLKWISQDIAVEGKVELEASGLTWKQVSKAISRRALSWYKAKITAV